MRYPVKSRARRITQTPQTFANWPALLLAMARGRPDELTFRTRSGVTITCPNRPGARVPVYEIFAEDCYRLRPFLGPLLDRPIQAVDIGGHVGTFTCRLTTLHPQASVLAFEPSRTSAGYLRRNAAQNRVADRVQVVERALAATSGSATFRDNGAGSGLNGLAVGGAEVQTISFDDAVAAAGAPVDVVKIDCEGGEYDLVLGSSAGSWAPVQRVVMEYHPMSGHAWAELESFFAGVGLTVQQIVTLGGYGTVWLSRTPIAMPGR